MHGGLTRSFAPADSPDGSQLAYVANYQLYLKSMSEMSSQAIQVGEFGMATMNPVFSPDSRSLAFYSSADKALKRMAVTGGGAVTIAAIGAPFGLSWPTDDVILIGQGSPRDCQGSGQRRHPGNDCRRSGRRVGPRAHHAAWR